MSSGWQSEDIPISPILTPFHHPSPRVPVLGVTAGMVWVPCPFCHLHGYDQPAGARQADGLTRSREAAKPRRERQKVCFRCSVFGVWSGEPRTEVRGCGCCCDCWDGVSAVPVLSPAWIRSACWCSAGGWSHTKPRSREGNGRRSVFGVRCSVRRAADGSPRVRVVL